jgi:hypothetical protein
VLAVPATMTGDDSAQGAQAKEFGKSFRASDAAFLPSGSILPEILIQAIGGEVLSDARVVRLLLSPMEIY